MSWNGHHTYPISDAYLRAFHDACNAPPVPPRIYDIRFNAHYQEVQDQFWHNGEGQWKFKATDRYYAMLLEDRGFSM